MACFFMRSTHRVEIGKLSFELSSESELNMPEKRTLFEKVWDEHVVCVPQGVQPCSTLICIWSMK